MVARLPLARLVSSPKEWDRRRLQVLLTVGLMLALVLLVGMAWSITALAGGDSHQPGAEDSQVESQPAGRAVPATLDDARPGPLAASAVGTIEIPPSFSLGPAQVATGFPYTPEGALAQLVAIDQRAIQSASVVTAQDVITAWAAQGGPTAETWTGVEAVRALLDSAGLPADGSAGLVIELHPAMGLIRNRAITEVTPCIDYVLTTRAGQAPPSRIAVADCQRMVWSDGRWLIGPGAEPTPAPSVWPGTQTSYDAGYHWLEIGQ